MGTYSEKYFDVGDTNTLFGSVCSAFEEYKTYAKEHYASIDSFSTTDNWQGVDADAGKTLLSTDVYDILTSIIDMQDKLAELQEDILTTFSENVDAATDARIKVGALETIKSDFAAFSSKFDYYATEEENMVEHFINDYSKYNVTFTEVDFKNDRNTFTVFCGADKSDENGYLHECMQKLINFDTTALSYLKEQKLVTAINNIAKSMSMDVAAVREPGADGWEVPEFITRSLGEINGVDYYSEKDDADSVAANKGKSEPSWIQKRGAEIIAINCGDFSYKEYSQGGVKVFPGDEKKNGERKNWTVKKRELSATYGSGKGKKAGPFKKWNDNLPHQHEDEPDYARHYAKDFRNGKEDSGKGKLGRRRNGEEFTGPSDTYRRRYAREKLDRKLFTVGEFGLDGSKEISAKDYYGRAGDDNTYVEGEAKFATAEVHAGAHAGLYRYETTSSGEKKKVFSPAVNAEVGASCAAFDGSVNARAGNKYAGVYGKGNVRALSAEGSAGLDINYHEVHAHASAEADLVKASGSVGGEVLGVRAGVNGSVKIGVGAHADIGYSDGVVKCEIGAALGIGVDVGFEVDIGGAVKSISGAAQSAWDEAGEIAGGAVDWFTSLW